VDLGNLTNDGSAGIYLDQATPSLTNYALAGTGSLTLLNSTTAINVRISNADRITVTNTAISFTPGAATSGAVDAIGFTTPASTGQTAGSETMGFDVNMSATITHASNTIIPTNRDAIFQHRTHAFATSGGVMTNAATVAITNAPQAGTNATITNAYALWVQNGVSAFDGKVKIGSGVSADAGGFKHSRVTTGSVAGGSTALVTVTWGTAFADANYSVTASVLDATSTSLSLSVVHVESITASAVTVRVINNSVGALTGTVHVIAVHD
jgi:hypothetical protein